jgi:hypothetical protein
MNCAGKTAFAPAVWAHRRQQDNATTQVRPLEHGLHTLLSRADRNIFHSVSWFHEQRSFINHNVSIMAYLPSTPLELHGGCLCSAVRYSIRIPALESRPVLPPAFIAARSLNPGETSAVRFPLISVDHCGDCRRAVGTVVQAWFICQHSWVEFQLQPREANDPGTFEQQFKKDEAVSYACLDVARADGGLSAKTYLGHYMSSKDVHRCFCARCGTSVLYSFMGDRGPSWTLGTVVDIALGTLDKQDLEREGVRPDRHLWWNHGIGWVKEMLMDGDSGMLRHPHGRPSERVPE